MKKQVVEIIGLLYQNKTQEAVALIDQQVRQCVPVNELSAMAVCLGWTELLLAFQAFAGEAGF